MAISSSLRRAHVMPTRRWYADKINAAVTVFVSIRTKSHSDNWFQNFRGTVEAIPEIVEFYRMSGDVDYLLRVVVPDIKSYDAVYKKLIRAADFMDVSSSFAMEELKFTTTMPLTVGESNRENVNLQVGSTPRSLWVLLRVRNRIQLLGEAQEAMCRSGPHGDHEVGLRDPCSYTLLPPSMHSRACSKAPTNIAPAPFSCWLQDCWRWPPFGSSAIDAACSPPTWERGADAMDASCAAGTLTFYLFRRESHEQSHRQPSSSTW